MICSIECHPRLRTLNTWLLTGRTVRQVVEEFGVGEWAVRKHQKQCLPYKGAYPKKPTTWEGRMEELRLELWRLQLLGEYGMPVANALAVVRERKSLLELEMRSEGKLDATHRKLMLNSKPAGEFEVRFKGGRMQTVEVGEE